MKKTTDEELNQWRFQYPSTTVSRRIEGNESYAQSFIGEAQLLLYQTKNRMKLGNLRQLRSIRNFDDGTIIEAKSIFGQDFITINVSKAIPIVAPTCSITLYNVPESVPPMRWYSDGIHEGEVEGIDYIKTYFDLSINCYECSALDFTVCETEELTADQSSEEKKCKPFTFLKPEGIPYYQGDPDVSPPIPPDPENHCIHSLSDCQAEIIRFGSDVGGSYFLWKAYTEWGSLETFSRTGLGYLFLKAFINLRGKQLCASKGMVVKVDCCLKTVDNRKVEIWWKDWGTCQPFIYYAGETLCKMPTQLPIAGFYGLSGYSTFGALYAIPEVNGGCLPFEWTVSGPIEIVNTSLMGTLTYYKISEIYGCNDPVTIMLRDRCGEEYKVIGAPCCEDATELAIGYTSLTMGCSLSQTLSAEGGCPPYGWSLSGGGTLTPIGEGQSSAIYLAPDTNANCASNPTITLIECCGNSKELKLAVNCYTGAENAFVWAGQTLCASCIYTPTGYGFCVPGSYYTYGHQWSEKYDCYNIMIWSCYVRCGGRECCDADMVSAICFDTSDCSYSCSSSQCPGCTSPCPPDVVCDKRTQAMKDAGCCPLNPITGLPY